MLKALGRLRSRQATLLGRVVLLLVAELVANGVIWAAAAVVISQADNLVGLALLAWVSDRDLVITLRET